MSDADQSQLSALLHEDIISNILTKLPVKSICRFKCVCKTWLNIISAQPFVDSHFARSKSESNLLVTVCRGKSRYVFIADPALEQQKGSTLVLRQSVTMPVNNSKYCWEISPGDSQSVEGLMFNLCSKELIRIANPSTNKRFAISPVIPRSSHEKTYLYVSLGFDPVEGKHKLLESVSILGPNDENVERTEHCVVTIGDDMNCCRYVKDGPSINRGKNAEQEICVNGVIYSKAAINWPSRGIDGWEYCLVAFDVRTESFQAVKYSIKGRFNHDPYPWRFVEFEGKVAILDYPLSNRDSCYEFEDCEHALELWVLEDFQNQVWSLKFAALPPLPMKMDDMNKPKHRLVGTTLDGELVFAVFEGGDRFSNPFFNTSILNVKKGMALSFVLYDMKTGDFRRSKVCFPEGFALTGEIKIMAMGHVEKLLCIGDEEKLKAVVRTEEELEGEMKKMRVEYEEWRKAAVAFSDFDPFIDGCFLQNLDAATGVLTKDIADEEKLEMVKMMRMQNEHEMKTMTSHGW